VLRLGGLSALSLTSSLFWLKLQRQQPFDLTDILPGNAAVRPRRHPPPVAAVPIPSPSSRQQRFDPIAILRSQHLYHDASVPPPPPNPGDACRRWAFYPRPSLGRRAAQAHPGTGKSWAWSSRSSQCRRRVAERHSPAARRHRNPPDWCGRSASTRLSGLWSRAYGPEGEAGKPITATTRARNTTSTSHSAQEAETKSGRRPSSRAGRCWRRTSTQRARLPKWPRPIMPQDWDVKTKGDRRQRPAQRSDSPRPADCHTQTFTQTFVLVVRGLIDTTKSSAAKRTAALADHTRSSASTESEHHRWAASPGDSSTT